MNISEKHSYRKVTPENALLKDLSNDDSQLVATQAMVYCMAEETFNNRLVSEDDNASFILGYN